MVKQNPDQLFFNDYRDWLISTGHWKWSILISYKKNTKESNKSKLEIRKGRTFNSTFTYMLWDMRCIWSKYNTWKNYIFLPTLNFSLFIYQISSCILCQVLDIRIRTLIKSESCNAKCSFKNYILNIIFS